MAIRHDEKMIVKARWSQIGLSFNGIKWNNRHAVFECKCGTRKIVAIVQVNSDRSTSCGCYNKEVVSKKRTTHGNSSNPSFRCWYGMIDRCFNKKNIAFKSYGGRGITVCDMWIESFENFIEDMGERPKGFSIDRVDNSLGYFKENCRWATIKEQNRNRRSNAYVTINEQTKTIAEWADESGINYYTIHSRMSRQWTPEEAVFKKPRHRSK